MEDHSIRNIGLALAFAAVASGAAGVPALTFGLGAAAFATAVVYGVRTIKARR